MRSSTAGLVLGLAATLGTVVGAVVLPDRGTGTGANPVVTKTPTGKSGSPRPTVSSTPSTPDGGPVSTKNLLTAADFRKVGLVLEAKPSDVRLELVGCDKLETLDSVALSGPPVQGAWESDTVVAYQQTVAARDAEEAAESARKVLRKFETCQKAAAGHWVYGPTHSEQLGPETAVSWLGQVDGDLNTTGKAPAGEKISGGVAVLRRGSHVGVLTINWCASAGDEPSCIVAGKGAYQQLVALSKAAALRLG